MVLTVHANDAAPSSTRRGCVVVVVECTRASAARRGLRTPLAFQVLLLLNVAWHIGVKMTKPQSYRLLRSFGNSTLLAAVLPKNSSYELGPVLVATLTASSREGIGEAFGRVSDATTHIHDY